MLLVVVVPFVRWLAATPSEQTRLGVQGTEVWAAAMTGPLLPDVWDQPPPSLIVLPRNPILFTYCTVYRTIRSMYTILRSATFDQWLGRLRDRQGVSRIVARLLAAEDGHLGDVRPVGEGVSEMRIQHGPVDTGSTSSREALK